MLYCWLNRNLFEGEQRKDHIKRFLELPFIHYENLKKKKLCSILRESYARQLIGCRKI